MQEKLCEYCISSSIWQQRNVGAVVILVSGGGIMCGMYFRSGMEAPDFSTLITKEPCPPRKTITFGFFLPNPQIDIFIIN